MKSYVTFDVNGCLTGSYLQEVLPEHAQCHLEVPTEVRLQWLNYRMNNARNGVEWISPPAPVLSVADYRSALQKHMDTKAQEREYDDIKSAALRAGYAGPFHDEGVKYAQWMDACWAKSYQVLAGFEAGEISQPTIEELLNQMPDLVL